MNSILQCLSNCSQLAHYFMDVSFIQDLNEMSPSRSQIALQFGKLMEILWSDDYKSFAPYVLKELMGKQYAIFQVELVNNEL